MRSAVLWRPLVIMLLLVSAGPLFAEDALRPIMDYLRDADYEAAKISPSGKRLALTQRQGEIEALIVLDIEAGSVLSATQYGKDEDIRDFMWATEDRLLVQPGVRFAGYFDAKVATGELMAINFDGRAHRTLFGYRAGGGEISTGTRANKRKSENAWAEVIDLLPEDPRRVIIQKNSYGTRGANPEALKIDIFSGKTSRLASSPLPQGQFVTDEKSRVALVYGKNSSDRFVAYHRKGGKGDFALIGNDPNSGSPITPIYSDGKSAYWAMGYGAADTRGMYRWFPATNKYEEVFRHPKVDVNYTLIDENNDVYGLGFDNHFPDYHYPDPAHPLARAHVGVRKAFPGTDAYFVSFTKDNSKGVLRVAGPQRPAEFILVDLKTNSLTPLVKTRPWLVGAELAPTEPFAIRSRDGLELRGFLTLPIGEGKNLPVVVLPHGGPHGVSDIWGYNGEAQLLASRGYGVLQVNFRGSGGRGSEFQQAGYREWGAKMQDDLTDATRWLIQKGVADENRLCIMGGSYGGYAALQGVVREPDLYKCAIGIVGVYDLTMMLRQGDIPEFESGPAYLDRVLGRDMAVLRSRSPVYQAAKIKAKVLLVHGQKDERVPIEHAYRMRNALKKAGNPAEWLVEKREGHGFRDAANVEALYSKVLDFLHQHIGPHTKMGDA